MQIIMSKALNLVLLTLGGIFTLSILFKPKNRVDVIGDVNGDGGEPFEFQDDRIMTGQTSMGVSYIKYSNYHSANFGCETLRSGTGESGVNRYQYKYRVVKDMGGEWTPLLGARSGYGATSQEYTYNSKDECHAEIDRIVNKTLPPSVAPPKPRPALDLNLKSQYGLTGYQDLTNSFNITSTNNTGGWGNSGR